MATSSSTFTRGTRTWSSPAASPGTASSSPRWSGRFSRIWRCSGGRSTTSHCLPSTASPVDDVSRILPTLFIGRAPATAADVAGLKRQGISAVLSLQPEEDLAVLGLSWSRLEEWYRAAAIAAHRLPIEDWSAQAVIARLDEAGQALDRLLAGGATRCPPP